MDALEIMNDPSLSNYVDGGTDCECLFWGYGRGQDDTGSWRSTSHWFRQSYVTKSIGVKLSTPVVGWLVGVYLSTHVLCLEWLVGVYLSTHVLCLMSMNQHSGRFHAQTDSVLLVLPMHFVIPTCRV